MISLEYLKVSNPKGTMNNIQKMTKDQTEQTEKSYENRVLTRAPTINPKTKLKLLITCPYEKYRNVNQFG